MLLFLLLLTPCYAAILSISPLQFTLDINESSSTPIWSSLDLRTFSTAARDYIDGLNLLQSALRLDSDQYEGISFDVSVSNRRGVRKLQNTLEVTLYGDVSLSSDDLPSGEEVAEIVAMLFQNGEGLFIKRIAYEANKMGASDWLKEITGVDVVVTNRPKETPVTIADAENTNSGKLFIIIGVVGAVISLILLLVGVYYAKRAHNISPQTKKTPLPSSKSSKPSILKNTFHSNPPTLSRLSPQQDEESGDESNVDFMLAQAALNNTHSSIQPRRMVGGSASVVSGANSSYADDMSYAFSVDGQSMVGSRAGVGDVAIGAGGIAEFQNENGGMFRWNEDGTKVSDRVFLWKVVYLLRSCCADICVLCTQNRWSIFQQQLVMHLAVRLRMGLSTTK